MSKVKNRWLIALAGVSVHLSIGSAYAWSIYTKPINELTGWSPTSISFAFSIAIFVWVYLLHLWGNLLSIMVLKLREQLLYLFGAGIALTGVAIQVQSLPLLYVTYGLIGESV